MSAVLSPAMRYMLKAMNVTGWYRCRKSAMKYLVECKMVQPRLTLRCLEDDVKWKQDNEIPISENAMSIMKMKKATVKVKLEKRSESTLGERRND